MSTTIQELGRLISEFSGVNGECDFLQGDGIGFTPSSNDETHIPVSDLITLAENRQQIDEELILKNLSI